MWLYLELYYNNHTNAQLHDQSTIAHTVVACEFEWMWLKRSWRASRCRLLKFNLELLLTVQNSLLISEFFYAAATAGVVHYVAYLIIYQVIP